MFSIPLIWESDRCSFFFFFVTELDAEFGSCGILVRIYQDKFVSTLWTIMNFILNGRCIGDLKRGLYFVRC
jgi:hypothetical protein